MVDYRLQYKIIDKTPIFIKEKNVHQLFQMEQNVQMKNRGYFMGRYELNKTFCYK